PAEWAPRGGGGGGCAGGGGGRGGRVRGGGSGGHGGTGGRRGVGDGLRDRLRDMSGCGFEAFAVRADKDVRDALNAFGEFSQRYQGAFDEPAPLFRRRAAAAEAKVSA
ncbi:hypothetical protein DIJ60_37810, partial [Burkholderia pseudomallei]